MDFTPEQLELLQKELAEAKARVDQLESEKAELTAAKEQADVTQQELEAKVAERDSKLNELYAKESEYMELQAEIDAMRKSAFNDNLGKCFDMSALADEPKAFVKDMFMSCYGTADVAPYMERAALIVKVAGAATDAAREAAKCEGTKGDEENSSKTEGTPAPAPETAAKVEPAPEAPVAPPIAGNKPVEPRFGIKHILSPR